MQWLSPQSASWSVPNCVRSLLLVVDTCGWTAKQPSMDLAISHPDAGDVRNFIWLPASFQDSEWQHEPKAWHALVFSFFLQSFLPAKTGWEGVKQKKNAGLQVVGSQRREFLGSYELELSAACKQAPEVSSAVGKSTVVQNQWCLEISRIRSWTQSASEIKSCKLGLLWMGVWSNCAHLSVPKRFAKTPKLDRPHGRKISCQARWLRLVINPLLRTQSNMRTNCQKASVEFF